MSTGNRQFKLRIWGLALGYFIFYAPYAALIKVVTTGLWPGVGGPVEGSRLLPLTIVTTSVVLLLYVWLTGWWKYAGRRRIFGVSVPFPAGPVFLSGLGTAVIIGATTLAFTFRGVSIVFTLVLMRAGVLIIAPVVDGLFKRRVRWFSWIALGFSLLALPVILADVSNYEMSTAAALTIAAYLAGYVLRLPCINKLAKSDEQAATHRYLAEEIMVAVPLLLGAAVVIAGLGGGDATAEVGSGFSDIFVSSLTLPAVLIGALYAGLYCFGTLIYLDCRENSFCIPLNRSSSLLAGVLAAYAVAALGGLAPPSGAQLASAGLIIIALLFLSPLHHFQRQLARLRRWLTGERTAREGVALAAPALASERGQLDGLRQVLLFVCSGNTCRSPMAVNISNAEIVARLKIPFESLAGARVQARSAGLSVVPGAAMTPEAQEVLSLMGFPVAAHRASGLTSDLVQQVERIFCMTQAHRSAVVGMFPSAARKTHCLDPGGDIEDPIGRGMAAYMTCAQRIHTLVRSRLDELGLHNGNGNGGNGNGDNGGRRV